MCVISLSMVLISSSSIFILRISYVDISEISPPKSASPLHRKSSSSAGTSAVLHNDANARDGTKAARLQMLTLEEKDDCKPSQWDDDAFSAREGCPSKISAFLRSFFLFPVSYIPLDTTQQAAVRSKTRSFYATYTQPLAGSVVRRLVRGSSLGSHLRTGIFRFCSLTYLRTLCRKDCRVGRASVSSGSQAMRERQVVWRPINITTSKHTQTQTGCRMGLGKALDQPFSAGPPKEGRCTARKKQGPDCLWPS